MNQVLSVYFWPLLSPDLYEPCSQATFSLLLPLEEDGLLGLGLGLGLPGAASWSRRGWIEGGAGADRAAAGAGRQVPNPAWPPSTREELGISFGGTGTSLSVPSSHDSPPPPPDPLPPGGLSVTLGFIGLGSVLPICLCAPRSPDPSGARFTACWVPDVSGFHSNGHDPLPEGSSFC